MVHRLQHALHAGRRARIPPAHTDGERLPGGVAASRLDRRGSWALIDTGIQGYTTAIERAARRLFSVPPVAILLTHGHFDHVGSVRALARRWRVPVYAHPLEMPYLTGESPYPPPDPTVGGGSQSWLSPLFPRGPIDLRGTVQSLPRDGAVPGLAEWHWISTPGHSPGHVSFFRAGDRTLIAGDAIVATRQESTLAVMRQRAVVWRPPAYFTCDWEAARQSVETLAALDPEVLATGHGPVLRGARMRRAVRALAVNFDRVMPASGRYVPFPAVTDGHGLVHVPPRVPFDRAAVVRAALGASALGVSLALVGAKYWRRSPSTAG